MIFKYTDIGRPNSSAVELYAYNYGTMELLIRFNGGNDYLVKDFDYVDFDCFIEADSLGHYYNTEIKGEYPTRRVYSVKRFEPIGGAEAEKLTGSALVDDALLGITINEGSLTTQSISVGGSNSLIYTGDITKFDHVALPKDYEVYGVVERDNLKIDTVAVLNAASPGAASAKFINYASALGLKATVHWTEVVNGELS